jgi:hypothetical protein
MEPTCNTFFFWIRGNPTPRKAHFVGPGERVKPRLSQALTRGARPDSNSKLAVQISSPLPSRYAPWGPQLVIPKHFLHKYLEREVIPQYIHVKEGYNLKLNLGRAQGLPANMLSMIRHLSCVFS